MPIYSPLRYPGGKRKLIPYVERILDENNIRVDHYAEPYAGGAAVGLHLLLTNKANFIHINDLNCSIFAFWYSILNFTDEFCKKINDTKIDLDEWTKQKSIQITHESIFDLGFSTFFLNRTNRSGILKGGVIGGKSQSGNYLINARFSKQRLIDRIELIAQHKTRIFLTQKDAINFLVEDITPLTPTSTFIYLDPPYYGKGQKLYDNFYRHDDHQKIRNYLSSLDHRWILSYDDNIEILKMYSQLSSETYFLNYTTQNKVQGKEVMFFSPTMKAVPYLQKVF